MNALPAPLRAALAAPAGLALTLALRRVARDKPAAFARLAVAGANSILIVPDDLPAAFLIVTGRRRVRVVGKTAAPRADAAIAAPLRLLLSLMDGSADADAAFFSRRVRIEGGVGAAMALRAALEEAEITLIDLLPLPARLRAAARAAGGA
ncbi:MAG: SCP2 sterol-binding domain-containing protein [Maricaulaceae bacterium]|nr:SCP2 sterol-binding domain-containing protein [Maricaulaceae bacterium]